MKCLNNILLHQNRQQHICWQSSNAIKLVSPSFSCGSIQHHIFSKHQSVWIHIHRYLRKIFAFIHKHKPPLNLTNTERVMMLSKNALRGIFFPHTLWNVSAGLQFSYMWTYTHIATETLPLLQLQECVLFGGLFGGLLDLKRMASKNSNIFTWDDCPAEAKDRERPKQAVILVA